MSISRNKRGKSALSEYDIHGTERINDLEMITLKGITPTLKMNVYSNGDQFISRALKQRGIWEPAETLLSLKYIKPGYTVLDIGANIGYYTLLFSRYVGPNGQVYSFEPEPRNFAVLHGNVSLNNLSNVISSRLALSNKKCLQELYTASDNLGDHRLSYKQGRASITVELDTMDHFFSNRGKTVHFVKIDTQGAEEMILDGMAELITMNTRHLLVLTEFSPILLMLMGSSYRSYLKLLTKLSARVIQFSSKENGQIKINRITIDDLEDIARHLLSLGIEDEGINVFLCFSQEAEGRFLHSQLKPFHCC